MGRKYKIAKKKREVTTVISRTIAIPLQK